MPKISNIVSLKPFVQVIDFQADEPGLVDKYIVLEQTAVYFRKILEGLSRFRTQDVAAVDGPMLQTHRCHRLTGTYGVGKSYFLLILRWLLEALEDHGRFEELFEKFSGFTQVQDQLRYLKDQSARYIVVSINGKAVGELPFKDLIETQVFAQLEKNIGANKLHLSGFFSQAVKLLEDWQNTNNPNARAFEEKLRAMENLEYRQLMQALERREMAAKNKFTRVYEATVLQAFPRSTFENLNDFLSECDRNVKENGYKGIVILFDELSAYLHSRVELGYLSQDLSHIDILSEATMLGSLKELHFVTTEHEDVETILRKSIDNWASVQRVTGRFQMYSLHFERGSQLIAAVLHQNNNEFRKLYLEHKNCFDQLKSMRPAMQTEATYPLNPYATDYLLNISEKYAQNDRTVFSFIEEVLAPFLQLGVLKDNAMLNLLGPERVMDYFEERILKEREELAKVYWDQLSRCSNDVERQMVKLLALDYAIVISNLGRSTTRIRSNDIQYALLLDEQQEQGLEDFLQREGNDSQSYIIYNQGLGCYELSPDSAGVNLEFELDQELANCNESSFLNTLLQTRDMAMDMRQSYTVPKAVLKFPFDRKIKGSLVKELGAFETLDLKAEAQLGEEDGKIVFYLPPVGKVYDYQQLYRLASIKAQEMENYRLVIAIPKRNPFSDNQARLLLNRFEAAQRVSKKEAIASNPRAMNNLRIIIVDARSRLYSMLSSFGRAENMVFFCKDEIKTDVKNIQDFMEWWLAEKLYPKFPVIEADDFSTRNSSNTLITSLVVPGQLERVDINGTAILNKHIRWSLQPWDLVKLLPMPEGRYKVSIKAETSNPIIKEIFDVFAQPESEKSLELKRAMLKSSPYGLNDPVLEVLFAIFLQMHEEFYLQDRDSRRVEVTADSMNSFWSRGYILKATEDLVSIEIKQDMINIMQITDENFRNIQLYKMLSASWPSDTFNHPGKSQIIINYCNTVVDKVRPFLRDLEALYGNDVSLCTDELYEVMNLFNRIQSLCNPRDFIQAISGAIDRFFDNEVSLKVNDINIPRSRYDKLQNLFDNILWMEQHARDIVFIKERLQNLMSGLQNTKWEILREQVLNIQNNVTQQIQAMLLNRNWKNIKYQQLFELDKLNHDLENFIAEYNHEYTALHDSKNHMVDDIYEAVSNYSYADLIGILEKIGFNAMVKLEQIRKNAAEVKHCSQVLLGSTCNLAGCRYCGSLSELNRSFTETETLSLQLSNTLGSLLPRYIELLEDLLDRSKTQANYGRDKTIIEFIEQNHPEQSETIKELFVLIRDSWSDHADAIKLLLDRLTPVINLYIKPEEEKVPEPSPPQRRVKLEFLMRDLTNKLSCCGYQQMAAAQFENELLKQLRKLRREYDMVELI